MKTAKRSLPIAIIMSTVISICMMSMSFVIDEKKDSVHKKYQIDLDSLADALSPGSGITEIDGEIYLVDTIPCCSSGKIRKSIFSRMMHSTYVECSSCKQVAGVPDFNSGGRCISVRKVERHDVK